MRSACAGAQRQNTSPLNTDTFSPIMPSETKTAPSWISEVFQHPLVRQLSGLITDLTGMRLVFVYPTASGWGQRAGDTRTERRSRFCEMIQSTPDGANQCRLCHIMMTVAACGGAPTVQRCHAGASALAVPVARGAEESVAIISSCVFAEPQAWDDVRERVEEMGVNLESLQDAFVDLPHLDERRLELSKRLMLMLGDAVNVVRQNAMLRSGKSELDADSPDAVSISAILTGADDCPAVAPSSSDESMPLLIRTVCDLVQQRPDLPLSVKELSSAAGLSPNHFSSLFRQATGRRFTRYLTEVRMALAKRLLDDATLHINEIARRVGYDDPGYFTRRFRLLTTMTPGEWRNRKREGAHPDLASSAV